MHQVHSDCFLVLVCEHFSISVESILTVDSGAHCKPAVISLVTIGLLTEKCASFVSKSQSAFVAEWSV